MSDNSSLRLLMTLTIFPIFLCKCKCVVIIHERILLKGRLHSAKGRLNNTPRMSVFGLVFLGRPRGQDWYVSVGIVC